MTQLRALAVCWLFAAYAFAEPTPYLIGSMSINPAFGLPKRQAGYQPTQHNCGDGADCAAACGQGYITCPSTDDSLHCFDPAINETCCPDGTGNSCSDGYYCTQDSTGNTWCCPNGLGLAACAAAYSLTGALVSETATTSSPTAASTSVSVSASVTSIPTGAFSGTTCAGCQTGKATSTSPSGTSTTPVQFTPSRNGSTTTSSSSVQFTGAANQAALGGLFALVPAVGALFL